MPRVARAKCHTGFYHVVIRGNGKQIIFEEKEDFDFFLKRVKKYSEMDKVEIHAYCLMDNHVHFLLRAEEGGGVDAFMHRLQSSYARYYNSKYERRGHLFQDRFFSDPVLDRRGFFACIRYILKNPEKAGICPLEKYEYSSFGDYYRVDAICNTDYALNLAGGLRPLLEIIEADADEDDEIMFELDATSKKEMQAKKIICDTLGVASGTEILSYEKSKRDEAILLLKSKGLTSRQIERLTGVGRGVIQRLQLEG